jgi:hypothetical protein
MIAIARKPDEMFTIQFLSLMFFLQTILDVTTFFNVSQVCIVQSLVFNFLLCRKPQDLNQIERCLHIKLYQRQ